MNIVPTQEDITVYASDPLSEKTQPPSPEYADGVDVGYTAPGPWWNWLWNKITSFFTAHKSDWNSMAAEVGNVLSSASITPSGSDSHQFSKAINQTAYNACDDYNNAVAGGHKINQPYVIGNTLYIPDTELL